MWKQSVRRHERAHKPKPRYRKSSIDECNLPTDAGVAIDVNLVDLVTRASHFERSLTTIRSGKGRLLGVHIWLKSGGDVWYSII